MAVPTIDERPVAPRRISRWPIRAARQVAVIAAVSLWLGACAPIADRPPPSAAVADPPMAEPAPAPGPIVLAPSLTGAVAAVPAAVPVLPPPRPIPPPPAPAADVATPTPPAAAAEAPTFAPASCPPGAIAMWSAPDAAGTAVPICRRLPPPR